MTNKKIEWDPAYLQAYLRYRVLNFFAVLQYDGSVICGRRKEGRIDHESDPKRFRSFKAANQFMTKHGHELVEDCLKPYLVISDGPYSRAKMVEVGHLAHQVHYWEQIVGTSILRVVVPGHKVRIIRPPGELDSQILLDGVVIWERVYLSEGEREVARRVAKLFQSTEEELADRMHQSDPDCAHGHPADVSSLRSAGRFRMEKVKGRGLEMSPQGHKDRLC